MVEVQTQDNKNVPVQDIPKAKVTLGEAMLAERDKGTKPIKEMVDNFINPIVSKTKNVFSRVELGNLVPTATPGKQQNRNIGIT